MLAPRPATEPCLVPSRRSSCAEVIPKKASGARAMFVVDRTNREQYYRYLARLNFEAAEAADRKIGLLPGYETAAPPPVMTLCAHCIELSLKSFLLQRGVTEADVRALGHNLNALWARCAVVAPTDVPTINQEVLAMISDLLTSGRLRYGEKPGGGLVPVYGPLSDLCRQCLTLCGAPSLSDLTG